MEGEQGRGSRGPWWQRPEHTAVLAASTAGAALISAQPSTGAESNLHSPSHTHQEQFAKQGKQ